MMRRAALLALILLATAPARAEDMVATFKAGMPEDITGFLDRADRCNKWAAQDPTDPTHAAAINTAMDKLHCQSLQDDEDALRAAHHDDANIIDRLDKADEYYSATD